MCHKFCEFVKFIVAYLFFMNFRGGGGGGTEVKSPKFEHISICNASE
jgi:hypothetical protein